MNTIVPPPTDAQAITALLAEIHALALETYTEAGVLIMLSASNKVIGGRRPCDLIRDRDVMGLTHLRNWLDSVADGVFA